MATPPDRPSRSHGRLNISASAVPRDLMEEPRLVASAWKARVITLFPDAFPGTLGLSLTGKALEMGLWSLQTLDLRSFGEGRHRNVDETPAGGGGALDLLPFTSWSPRRVRQFGGRITTDLPCPNRRRRHCL